MLIRNNLIQDNNDYLLICLYFSILIVSSLFSPLICFIMGMLTLFLLSPFMKIGLIRVFTVSLVFFQLSVIFASRKYYDELNSDLGIYYDVYHLVNNDIKSGLSFFGGGLEIGWSLLYWVVGRFLTLEPIQLALVNSIISFLLIFIWMEKIVIPTVQINERGIVYFFFLLFLNFIMLGFLQRQSLTLGLLLFALTAKKNRTLFFLVFIASFVHLSSIPIGIIIYLTRKVDFTSKKIFYLILIFIIFRLALIPILSFIMSLLSLDVVSHKLNVFSKNGFTISTLRYVILYLCLFPFLFKKYKFESLNEKYLYNYAVVSAIAIVSFIGVPLFADRIFMISLAIYGIFYYKYLYINNKLIGILLALTYLLLFILEKTNVVGSLTLGDAFWSRYNYWGNSILYYLQRL